jgi:hypothetical protein
VPEPGLVIWGSVVNATNPAQPVVITSVAWSVTDSSNTAIYAASTRPPTQIVALGGQQYYVLEVPFDTRTFGSVTLAKPTNSFELKSSLPPTYTMVPTINGVPASVRSVNGSPATGTNYLEPGFTATTRGKVVRVDLAIVPPTETYEIWAARYWPPDDANAARTADPDGDGLNNEGEFYAGTDPKSPASALRIVTLTVNTNQTQVTVGWQSVSNKNYRLEAAPNVDGPWAEVGSPVQGAANSTQANLSRNPADPKSFYRVRLLP